MARCNPITYVRHDTPPFLIVHGDQDPLVPYFLEGKKMDPPPTQIGRESMEKNQEVIAKGVELTGREAFALSHGIRRGNHLYISGQVPRDGENNLVGEQDLEAQCVQVYANIQAIVTAAGGTMADIVDTLVIVTDNSYKAGHTAVRKRYFQPPYPACTTIIAGLSPGYMIEINAVAILE